MTDFKHTRYFYPNMIAKHAEVLDYLDYVEQALKKPLAVEEGHKGRMIHYVYISELDRYLAVIVEPDGETVHNAYFDRSFKKKMKRRE